MPKMKINATVVLAAAELFGLRVAILLVPVIIAKHILANTVVYRSSGLLPILSLSLAPKMAPKKLRAGLMPFNISTIFSSVMPADSSMAGR